MKRQPGGSLPIYDNNFMSVIDKIRNAKRTLFTFELLPPLKGHSIERVYSTIDRLIEFSPAYINFTTHRNETVYRERPDGLLEKRVVRKIIIGFDKESTYVELQAAIDQLVNE